MKKYIALIVLLIYLSIAASQEMKYIAWLFFALVAIAFLIIIFFGSWYISERMRMIRANRVEAEKQANVMTVTNNGQVFIRETDHNAKWQAIHLNPKVYTNGSYETPSQIEIEAWQQFNRPKTIEKVLQLPATVSQGVATSFNDILDTHSHLMIIGGTGSGKTTLLNNAIEYRLKQSPRASVGWLSTHASLDSIHPRAKIIQEPEMIMSALSDVLKMYENRVSKAGQYSLIILALDEWSELVGSYKEAGHILKRLARGGRKANINLLLANQGDNVGDLGIKNFGNVKSNFAEIYLPSPGRGIYQKTEIVLPDGEAKIIGLKTEQVKEMLARGCSKREISQAVWGGHGSYYNEKIDRIRNR